MLSVFVPCGGLGGFFGGRFERWGPDACDTSSRLVGRFGQGGFDRGHGLLADQRADAQHHAGQSMVAALAGDVLELADDRLQDLAGAQQPFALPGLWRSLRRTTAGPCGVVSPRASWASATRRRVPPPPWRGCPRDARSAPRPRPPRAFPPSVAPAGRTSAASRASPRPAALQARRLMAFGCPAPASDSPSPSGRRRSCTSLCSAATAAPGRPGRSATPAA